MHYLVLCCDYDGTLAHDGVLKEETIAALETFKKSGRKLVMVTGRELPDLQRVCPRLDLFHTIVAENGALLYDPATRQSNALAKAPPQEFIAMLGARGVAPLSVGEVIVATWEPHERVVLESIRDLGLELQVIFNKGAVMVLPAGVNKATGLAAALAQMKLSTHNAIGIGDAENDHAFLAACECAVAVANALPALKETADIVTAGDHGTGVIELIEQILEDDLARHETKLRRHHVLLGQDASGNDVTIAPRSGNVLLLGTSGSGKSTIATGLIERLTAQGYDYCVIDPEGDYGTIESAVSIGTPSQPPDMDEIVKLLNDPKTNVVVNLVGLPFDDRPKFFVSLMTHLRELRTHLGRPHWIVLDEVHHLMPTQWESSGLTLPQSLEGVLQITVHADLVAPPALKDVNLVVSIGNEPAKMLAEFAAARDLPRPKLDTKPLAAGEALVWKPTTAEPPFRVSIAKSHTERRRHVRKYAEGELPEDRSFYFRGPDGKLNLRAQNLILFLQLGDGVDDATWSYHLHAHDYSNWIRECVKDDELADEIRNIEDRNPAAEEGRTQVRNTIEARYTLPVGAKTAG